MLHHLFLTLPAFLTHQILLFLFLFRQTFLKINLTVNVRTFEHRSHFKITVSDKSRTEFHKYRTRFIMISFFAKKFKVEIICINNLVIFSVIEFPVYFFKNTVNFLVVVTVTNKINYWVILLVIVLLLLLKLIFITITTTITKIIA